MRVLSDREDGPHAQSHAPAKSPARCALLLAETGLLGKPFNIVLMGMGEPLHNYDETMKALRILHDEHGLALPERRITLSTVGVLPALERLGHEALMPNLAISLHSTTEDQRDALVPVNRKYGLQDLVDACRRVSAEAPPSDHLRVRAARRRERYAGRRAASRRRCCTASRRRST